MGTACNTPPEQDLPGYWPLAGALPLRVEGEIACDAIGSAASDSPKPMMSDGQRRSDGSVCRVVVIHDSTRCRYTASRWLVRSVTDVAFQLLGLRTGA